ncbi:hypothetical protein Tfer_3017 [Thermincola ferriacetica]|uniref:Phage holin family protein n=1 Tax=Thermincola ferriacetica TaxID=281456 RepID=A0A0L6W047_9FIRM|nr:phage holin family protein [Thermincola ferriacetica]KNZ68439.1 hypothetical protein Tfer_3017 [Thermincola ferriacetica]
MKGLALRWFFNALALFITAYLLDGVMISGFGSALVAALVLGIVNAVIRPVILFFTLPLNFLTLGLFTFVVNALMFKLVSVVVDGFVVEGFFAALVGSLLLTIISGFLSALVRDH